MGPISSRVLNIDDTNVQEKSQTDCFEVSIVSPTEEKKSPDSSVSSRVSHCAQEPKYATKNFQYELKDS